MVRQLPCPDSAIALRGEYVEYIYIYIYYYQVILRAWLGGLLDCPQLIAAAMLK